MLAKVPLVIETNNKLALNTSFIFTKIESSFTSILIHYDTSTNLKLELASILSPLLKL